MGPGMNSKTRRTPGSFSYFSEKLLRKTPSHTETGAAKLKRHWKRDMTPSRSSKPCFASLEGMAKDNTKMIDENL